MRLCELRNGRCVTPIATSEIVTIARTHRCNSRGSAYRTSVLHVSFARGKTCRLCNLGVHRELHRLVWICGSCAWSGYARRKPGMVRNGKVVAWN